METYFELKDFSGKSVAIHCRTEEEADTLIKWLRERGCKNMEDNNYFISYKQETVYTIDKHNIIYYCDRKTVSENDYFILPMNLIFCKHE